MDIVEQQQGHNTSSSNETDKCDKGSFDSEFKTETKSTDDRIDSYATEQTPVNQLQKESIDEIKNEGNSAHRRSFKNMDIGEQQGHGTCSSNESKTETQSTDDCIDSNAKEQTPGKQLQKESVDEIKNDGNSAHVSSTAEKKTKSKKKSRANRTKSDDKEQPLTVEDAEESHSTSVKEKKEDTTSVKENKEGTTSVKEKKEDTTSVKEKKEDTTSVKETKEDQDSEFSMDSEDKKAKDGESVEFICTVKTHDDVKISWYLEYDQTKPLQKGDIYQIDRPEEEQKPGMVVEHLKIKWAIKSEEGFIYAKIKYLENGRIKRIGKCKAKLTIDGQKDEHWDIILDEKEKWKGVVYQQAEFTNKVMKVIRFCTQAFLLIALFSCIIISKGSFQILVYQLGIEEKRKISEPYKETATRIVILFLLSTLLILPDVLTVLYFLYRSCFGKPHHPGKRPTRERDFCFSESQKDQGDGTSKKKQGGKNEKRKSKKNEVGPDSEIGDQSKTQSKTSDQTSGAPVSEIGDQSKTQSKASDQTSEIGDQSKTQSKTSNQTSGAPMSEIGDESKTQSKASDQTSEIGDKSKTSDQTSGTPVSEIDDQSKTQSNTSDQTSGDPESLAVVNISYLAREVLHCVAIYGITFRVFPFLSPLEAGVFSLAFLLLPSLMHVCMVGKRKTMCCTNKCCSFVLVLVFVVFQVALFILILVYVSINPTALSTDSIIFIVISILFVPARWTRTYLSADKNGYKILRALSEDVAYSEDKKHTYSLTNLITAFCRMLVPVLFISGYYWREFNVLLPAFEEFILFRTNNTNNLNETITYVSSCTGGVFEYFIKDETDDVQWQYLVVGPYLAHVGSTFLTYHFSILACRLRMRMFGFAVPFLFAVLYGPLALPKRLYNMNDISLLGCYDDDQFVWLLFCIFVVGYFSQFVLCRHVFREQSNVMPFTENLFHTPHYCSPIADLSILHSRIREKDEEKENDVHFKTDEDNLPNPKPGQSIPGNKDETKIKIDENDAPFKTTEDKLSNPQPGQYRHENKDEKKVKTEEKDKDNTMIYVCATMWHEELHEMKSLILSLLRLDYDRAVYHSACRVKDYDPDPSERFDFEGHIFFDDAFVQSEDERISNKYVMQLETSITEALRELYNSSVKLDTTIKDTLYGRSQTWTLPGQNKLFVHLKDKEKFRHMKRWSQVMYFYYLLGYKLLQGNCKSKRGSHRIDGQNVEMKDKDAAQKVKNTFILALDGDVKFYPIALKRLLDRMKKNTHIAATSGRIIPCGSGPVVWYQRFEYAVGHWLQKTTEHMFGCVLCSPGCFTLFRGSSILSGNIMHTYASKSTKPRHYIQYDQGEDRWLSTLLLKEGFRVEYCAASEAKTFVPEEFGVLFTQRKRWIPSTMANIFDVITSSKEIRKKNPNISVLYIAYQCLLLVSTVLGPATILLAMDAAIHVVFSFQTWLVYILVYGPVAVYALVCLKLSLHTQRQIGLALSLAYALLMLAVLIGTFVSIIQEGWYTPSAIFVYILFGIFLVAGLLHIHEISELPFVFLYFILLPLGFLYIIIYAVCNLNDVSWGTRENQSDMTVAEDVKVGKTDESDDLKRFEEAKQKISTEFSKEVLERTYSSSSKTQTILYMFKYSYYLLQLKLLETLCDDKGKASEKDPIIKKAVKSKKTKTDSVSNKGNKSDSQEAEATDKKQEKKSVEDDPLFWRKLKAKYLNPIDQKNEKAVEELKRYKNKVASMFFFLNGIWIVIVISMNQVKHDLNITINFSNGEDLIIEPFGFTFLTMFAFLLFIQLIGMFLHRYRTFLHVIAATDMRSHQTHDNLKIKNMWKNFYPPYFLEWTKTKRLKKDMTRNVLNVFGHAAVHVRLLVAIKTTNPKIKNLHKRC